MKIPIQPEGEAMPTNLIDTPKLYNVLSFVGRKPGRGAGYDYWSGIAAGANYTEDCATGTQLAEEFVAYISKYGTYGNGCLLGSIVLAMEENGATRGHKIGFLNTVNKYAQVGGYLAQMQGQKETQPAEPQRPTSDYQVAWEKCRRLGKELSQALAETGDEEFAFIQPAGKQLAVSFGELSESSRSVLEYPVTTVDRLTTRLSYALDDWAEHTTFKSVAHVYPASTERGVYLMNMKVEVSRETPERANARLWDLLAEAGRIIAARPELKIDYVQVDEQGTHWFHRIPGEARRPR